MTISWKKRREKRRAAAHVKARRVVHYSKPSYDASLCDMTLATLASVLEIKHEVTHELFDVTCISCRTRLKQIVQTATTSPTITMKAGGLTSEGIARLKKSIMESAGGFAGPILPTPPFEIPVYSSGIGTPSYEIHRTKLDGSTVKTPLYSTDCIHCGHGISEHVATPLVGPACTRAGCACFRYEGEPSKEASPEATGTTESDVSVCRACRCRLPKWVADKLCNECRRLRYKA